MSERANETERNAGTFAAWATDMVAAMRGELAANVPCDGCTACCTSSQFVHIAPDETATLARVPPELLVPAPRMPRGHVVLGYDEHGHCPMLVDGACSIYEDRPRACRTYDCRIFPATGLDPAADGKPEIAARARAWRFRFSTPDDHSRRAAVRLAVEFVRAREPGFDATQLAARAVAVHESFLDLEPGLGGDAAGLDRVDE